jgi:hypothetical protein
LLIHYLGPKLRPSNQDAPAPICRLRRLPREMWTPPGSAPPANPDRAQSVLLGAATALESAVRRPPPAHPVAGLVCPGPVRLEPERLSGQVANNRANDRRQAKLCLANPCLENPAGRPEIHVLNPLHFHHPSVNPLPLFLDSSGMEKPDSLRGVRWYRKHPQPYAGPSLMFKIISSLGSP